MVKKENRQILVVDDVAYNRELLISILEDKYTLLEASNGREALDLIHENFQTLSLILLDIAMPEIDGTQVMKSLNKDGIHIPVIVVTGSADKELEKKCRGLGAVAFIHKPFDADRLRLVVDSHLKVKQYQEAVEYAAEKKLEKSAEIWSSMMQSLADIIECRNEDSGQHVKRTSLLTKILIREMNKTPKYGYYYSAEDARIVYEAAILHDIGKIGVPDTILLKPDKLTAKEYEQIQRHTVIGYELSEKINKFSTDEYRKYCDEVTLSHHERWDGTGYPNRLRGTDIPLSARIVAIADTYDALTGKRPYSTGLPHEKAVTEIKAVSGTQFDPYLVSVFCKIADEIKLAVEDL